MKKITLIALVCICLSFIASDCKDSDINIPTDPPANQDSASTLVLYSTNDGETWTICSPLDSQHTGYERTVFGIAHFTGDPGTFSILKSETVGSGIYLYEVKKTINNGEDYPITENFHTTAMNDIYSLYNNKGFILVDPSFTTTPKNIYMTSDAGSSWSEVQNNPLSEINLWRMDFDDGGEQGIIIPYNSADSTLITTDGGNSWVTGTPIYIGDYVNDIAVMDDGIAVACGNNGRIFMTTNLGSSWTQINSPATDDLQSISFFGSTGLIAGNNGTILRTTNDGLNWVKMPVSSTQNLTKIYASHQFGISYACGDNVIIKSFDYFTSPQIIRNQSNEFYKDISIAAGEIVYVVGNIRQ